MEKTCDVLISYQWDKQPQIRTLFLLLTSVGYSCWLDIDQMGGGDILHDEISKGIQGCKLFLACVTTRYSTSDNCIREVSLADMYRKRIIPLLLEKMPWPPGGPMSMLFADKMYINFVKPNADVQNDWKCPAFNELVKKINKTLRASKKQSTPLRGWNRTSMDPHQALVGHQPQAFQPHHPNQPPINYSYSPQPNYSPQNHAHAANYLVPQQMPLQYQINSPNYSPPPNYDQVPSVEQRNVVNAVPMMAQPEPHPTAERNLQSAGTKNGTSTKKKRFRIIIGSIVVLAVIAAIVMGSLAGKGVFKTTDRPKTLTTTSPCPPVDPCFHGYYYDLDDCKVCCEPSGFFCRSASRSSCSGKVNCTSTFSCTGGDCFLQCL